ncbi:MAG: rhomboid family intramembrane serine protease [Bacteroidales bacterium]|jgi:membrane associated rhomboid family serine protease|nr:rhomboid family intramembrane serine protease [Bacteroidales bacterium]
MYKISPAVKNLLIINVLLFVATYVLGSQFNLDLTRRLALYYPGSEYFRPYQFVTHMFMHGGIGHGGIGHIFFNMYALWMFGTPIENAWGGKRFLFYYLFCGLGAAALHTLVNYLIFSGMAADITAFTNSPSPEIFKQFVEAHKDFFNQNVYDFINQWTMSPGDSAYAATALENMHGVYQSTINIPTVGASGAIFGILLAFGMMYPNVQLMIIFLPVPIKAKWMVTGYGALELIFGVIQPGSSIAHFAHVGGMLFGFILIRYWMAQSRRRNI